MSETVTAVLNPTPLSSDIEATVTGLSVLKAYTKKLLFKVGNRREGEQSISACLATARVAGFYSIQRA